MHFEKLAQGETPFTPGGDWMRAKGVEVEGQTLTVYLCLAVSDDGRLVATSGAVETNGEELSARALRLPLSRVLRGFIRATADPTTFKRLEGELHDYPEGHPFWDSEASAGDPRIFVGVPSDTLTWERVDRVELRTRPGPGGHDDDFYRAFEETYNAVKATKPQGGVRKALAEREGYAVSTIDLHIRQAREHGRLLKASKPKPKAPTPKLVPPAKRGRSPAGKEK